MILGALTIAALGTLVVVTMTESEALSTVALVLAILSFAAQLIVTASQSAASNEQYRQMTRLYEQSNSVLEKIRSQSDALLVNQKDQFNKVLDHVLTPSVIRSAVGDLAGDDEGVGLSPDTDDNEQGSSEAFSAEHVARVLREEVSKALASPSARPAGRPSERDFATFPDEELGKEVLSKFEALSDRAKSFIRRMAETDNEGRLRPHRLARRRYPGRLSDLPPHLTELAEAGFISVEPARSRDRDMTIVAPTEAAATATRFFTGQGVIPPYLRDFLASDSAANS